MKIGLAQIKPKAGDINFNISKHRTVIKEAVKKQVSYLFFSELSLTGYEPQHASKLALKEEDDRLSGFQKLSDQFNICIGVGGPYKMEGKPSINMFLFSPNESSKNYAKQILHKDELPFFQAGNKQTLLSFREHQLALSICYESMIENHLEKSINHGANIYLASLAKDAEGINKAEKHFSRMSKKYNIPILMVNSIGKCDNFLSSGQSAIWNKDGSLVKQLNSHNEALLIYDIESNSAFEQTLNF